MPKLSDLRRRFAAFTALVLAACTGWRTNAPPGPLTRGGNIDNDRAGFKVNLKNGSSYWLLDAHIVKDSIVGNSRDNRPDFARMAFAFGDIKSVQTYGSHPGRTLALLLIILGSIGALAVACSVAFSDI